MIRIVATVAMDYGVLPTARTDLEALPKGSRLILDLKMARELNTPIEGCDCSILDHRGVPGWGRVDMLPPDCLVIGGMGSSVLLYLKLKESRC